MHEIPIEFICETILRRIGNNLGNFIKADMKALDANKMRYVRILVMMDVSKGRKESIWLGNFKQNIVYRE